MILPLLNWQGIVGIAASLCLALLFVLQQGETRHWRKQARQFEQLFRAEQAAFAGTVANYRAAADAARAADRTAAARVTSEQRAISERTLDDYQARVAVARAGSQRLRLQDPHPATARGGRAGAPVPSLSGPARGADQGPPQNRLSDTDRLIATEQAIQLDEMIKWVRRQSTVRPNGGDAPH